MRSVLERAIRLFLFVLVIPLLCGTALADSKTDKTFTAVVTDTKGVETELKNLRCYWEDKISETAFVPHELKYVPVKRGHATLHMTFESVKAIDVKPTENGQSVPLPSIALNNGQTGDLLQQSQGVSGALRSSAMRDPDS